MYRFMFAALAALMFPASSHAVAFVLDEDCAVISVGATTANITSSMDAWYQRDALLVQGTNAAATFTPNVSGAYNLWADWRTGDGITSYAIMAADGLHTVTLDASKNAAQGAAGSWASVSQAPSGWCYLGQYSLTAASTVRISNSAGAFGMDALRLASTDDVFIIDEKSAISNSPGSWSTPAAYSAPSLNADPNLDWAFTSSAAATMSYLPGVHAANVTIKLSWAVGNSGTDFNTQAKYWLDPDINNGTNSDWVLLATINQNKLADQLTTGSGTRQWSGWYTVAGTYDLYTTDNSETRVSAIILDANGQTRTTADVIGLVIPSQSSVPEPATLMLLGMGALGAMGCIRRQRMKGR